MAGNSERALLSRLYAVCEEAGVRWDDSPATGTAALRLIRADEGAFIGFLAKYDLAFDEKAERFYDLASPVERIDWYMEVMRALLLARRTEEGIWQP